MYDWLPFHFGESLSFNWACQEITKLFRSWLYIPLLRGIFPIEYWRKLLSFLYPSYCILSDIPDVYLHKRFYYRFNSSTHKPCNHSPFWPETSNRNRSLIFQNLWRILEWKVKTIDHWWANFNSRSYQRIGAFCPTVVWWQILTKCNNDSHWYRDLVNGST